MSKTKLHAGQAARDPAATARVARRQGGTGQQRPRLCVFRSLTHIYAQVIDDVSADDHRLGVRRGGGGEDAGGR